MANNNATNVSTGKPKVGGAIFVAPIGTTVPKDATTPLDPAFENVGYVSEDGVTKSVSTDNESIKAWGGDQVDNPRTGREEAWSFTAIENNKTVFGLVYGDDNVIVSADGITLVNNNNEMPNKVVVIEVIMKGSKIRRCVLPYSKTAEVGDVVFKDDEAIGYEITLSALPDEKGNSSYEHIAEVA